MRANASTFTNQLGHVVKKIAKSRVLMVGAGGIGCELLKNLAMTGFGHIEIVDLDTIDVTNLNRQFLFQRHHVSKPKSLVARDSALRFNPSLSITAHHANIMSPDFDLAWFQSFDIVFNALDNLAARRHVNLMCVAAKVPLIDAGTGGYFGQSTVIVPGETECYDCVERPTPKTFPVCTIRSTPSAPIHCVVWAKSFLFNQLFQEETEDDVPGTHDDTENEQQVEELAREAKALADLRSSASQPDYAFRVLRKVFVDDLHRLAAFADMWKVREPPTPLDLEALAPAIKQAQETFKIESKREREARLLSVAEAAAVFLEATTALGQRFATSGSQHFDKDDADAMSFVSAAATLRALVYSITPQKTFFELKSMAGNIVPIVATTNAIVSGLMSLHALQLLAGTSLRAAHPKEMRSRRPCPSNLHGPRDGCGVCSRGYVWVVVKDIATVTLGDVVEQIVKRFEGVVEADNLVVSEGQRMLYDPDMDENLELTLASFGIGHHAFLRVSQFDTDSKLVQPLTLYIDAKSGQDNMEDVTIRAAPASLWVREPVKESNKRARSDDEDDDGPIEVQGVDEPVNKKAKVSEPSKERTEVDGDKVVVVLDESDDEVISVADGPIELD
ncbi:hypothetical protein BCR44DRAFT_1429557 [Catenaria anguillulae PL171]|uniref:Ubiquitin-activating enzyme E1-like n=1 Tax=Catenaria anguillulae PL171 TaxID=765915 RepID=A0A1Y2HU17_9FUNG|nr:hypothetical protein BCR44DRAFT_1429557 [Catenaria anguillulae PL171]